MLSTGKDTINLIDANGLKQGEWKMYPDASKPWIHHKFDLVDDTIVGPVKVYENKRVILTFTDPVKSSDFIYTRKGDTIQGTLIDHEGSVKFVDNNRNDLPEDIDDFVWSHMAVKPMYYHGIIELRKILRDNINHKVTKKSMLTAKGQYKVVVGFVIDKNGRISEAKVIKSVDPCIR